jgi:acyl-CoA synthetase (AMP-forming)/AMP-acid ligase II
MSAPDTLFRCLERAAASGEGVRFLARSEERFVSYGEVLDRAARVAGGLESKGVRAGDRVGVAVPTGPKFYDAFFGALAAGAVPVSLPLPPRFGDGEDYRRSVAENLDAAGAQLLVSVRALRKRLGDQPAEDVEDLLSHAPRWTPVGADDLALVQLSSGTTGCPKAIGLTHRQVLANVRAMLAAFFDAYPPEEGFEHGGVSWLPLYHDMGLSGALLTALVHPGPLTLMRPEDFVARPVRWLDAISRFRATISAAPNFAYELALERVRDEEMGGIDLSCWLFALNGAEPVSPSTLERFQERFGSHGLRPEALTPVYGLAEASLAVTFSDPRKPFTWHRFDPEALAEGRAVVSRSGPKIASCGAPLPGYRVLVAGDDGEPLAEACIGRVLIQGPSVTLDGAREEGFLDTGDQGFWIDGELYLYGRAKDVVIIRGRNYAPEWIEQAVEGVDGVRKGGAAAVAVLGDQGEELCVLVEGRAVDDESRLIEEIRARLSERVGVVPKRIAVLATGSIPRTSSGKIRRREAARLFAP